MGTQKKIAEKIIDKGADYILQVKGIQEIREYYVEKNIEWFRKNHSGWKGLNGIGACRATVTEKGETTTSVSYSIYSRGGMSAGA